MVLVSFKRMRQIYLYFFQILEQNWANDAPAFLAPSVLLTNLFSQLGGDVIQDQLVMGKHQKLLSPSLQHVSDVLPEEANTKPTQIRRNHSGPAPKKPKIGSVASLSRQF